ncbi:hypothetical protein QYE76_008828 [Lolium multiflorum]|uniref:Uncharacterized protein n=1 Tax=Lolium multiflorum TaxID=4521 RepID=A0AAD8X0N2_LOLMU|nr:hypothetical protein QYE76_008828 [Lolium multiflorum]
MAAWKVACGASGTVTLMILLGTYYIGPTQFHGPRKASALTFLLQLGQGIVSWPFNKCPIRKNRKVLPTNTVVRDITSVNNKFFHIALLQNNNMKMINLRISAPENSPNMDGIHTEHSTGVVIADTRISAHRRWLHLHRPGERQHRPRPLRPGPWHERRQLWTLLRRGRCHPHPHQGYMTFEGTMNGVRIKTWENSPPRAPSRTWCTFKNMVMKDVQNPSIIDQNYCPYYNCEHKYVSGVTIKDITFKNIKGT